MKTSLGHPAGSAHSRAAFTLIELLAVMTIILVLAGLIINIAGSAQYNAAKSRATSEVKALETALESYKTDNGTYPPDPNYTDTTQPPGSNLLDPHNVQVKDNTDPTSARYINNSQYLYQILSGFPVTINGVPSSDKMSKAYMKFAPQQLKAVKTGDTVSPNSAGMYIIDPFGFSYGYSTIYALTVAYNQSNPNTQGSSQAVNVGYNPTFDLWSTAGYAPGGKNYPTNMPGDAAAAYSNLWIKNW